MKSCNFGDSLWVEGPLKRRSAKRGSGCNATSDKVHRTRAPHLIKVVDRLIIFEESVEPSLLLLRVCRFRRDLVNFKRFDLVRSVKQHRYDIDVTSI